MHKYAGNLRLLDSAKESRMQQTDSFFVVINRLQLDSSTTTAAASVLSFEQRAWALARTVDAFHYGYEETTTYRGIIALTITVGRCILVDCGCFVAP